MKKEVLVVGIPRCGTTYVFRSIVGLPQGDSTPKGRNYHQLPALKAHSLAPPDSFGDPYADLVKEHVDKKGKVIFLFGDPILAVASTVRHRFDRVHAKNCGCMKRLSDVSLYGCDDFNYERMFDSWMSFRLSPLLCLRYEKLDSVIKMGIVDSFLGRKINWNPLLERSTKIHNLLPGEFDAISTTYSSLIEKINGCPDVILRNL